MIQFYAVRDPSLAQAVWSVHVSDEPCLDEDLELLGRESVNHAVASSVYLESLQVWCFVSLIDVLCASGDGALASQSKSVESDFGGPLQRSVCLRKDLGASGLSAC